MKITQFNSLLLDIFHRTIPVLGLLITMEVMSQDSSEFWIEKSNYNKTSSRKEIKSVIPKKFKVFELNIDLLKSKLEGSSNHFDKGGDKGVIISFPNELGELEKFEVFEASIMSKGLQEKFPDIKSYVGKGVEKKGSIIRFSITNLGLNAVILQNSGRTIEIDKIVEAHNSYRIYSVDELGASNSFECRTENMKLNSSSQGKSILEKPTIFKDGNLRTYRLAVAVTAEYSQYHLSRLGISDLASTDDKKKIVLSVIVNTMTSVNALFERDLGITMKLVENNTDIIFLDSTTDNLTNNSFNLFNEGQLVIDNIIEYQNYDIGHTFSSGISGGVTAGIANQSTVCSSSGYKAASVSGSYNPIGFDFEGVIKHEMGHQFGANHTFNGVTELGALNPTKTSVEPGSGTTIMAYPGTCLDNIQLIRDNYFHFVTIQEVLGIIERGGANCADIQPFDNNGPEIQEIQDYVIPVSTPFAIKVDVVDSEEGINPLTYTWEQLDNELVISPPISTESVGPSFRSLPPSTESTRYFPNQETVLQGMLANTWEVLPSVSRTMNFGILVRDNNPNGGQTDSDEVLLTFDGDSGPFNLTSQKESELWFVKTNKTIRWNVANTNVEPVNCTHVNILLSIDGGYTYPYTLADTVQNDGEQEIEVPDVTTTKARIKVESVNNIFYAINSKNVSIQSIDDSDYDDDGVLNNDDECPLTPFGEYVDSKGCSDSQLDDDNDGIYNSEDNCSTMFNPNQEDADEDGVGDICDDDLDGDYILNINDNCPNIANSDQADFDSDGVGDVCDSDIDNDGVLGEKDYCPRSTLGEIVDAYGCTSDELNIPRNLWGMVQYGAQGFGSIFTYDLDSELKNGVHEFTSIEGGRFPNGSLIQAANGNLYGLTEAGGERHLGTLFEYNLTENKFTKKADFEGRSNGHWPSGDLVQAHNGKLYGVTNRGGDFDLGTLFEYDIDNNVLIKKVDFNDEINGRNPVAGMLVASNGKLYGTTIDGGENNEGTFYEYDIVLGDLRVLFHFDGATTGRHCFGKLIQSLNGNIYGMTRYGGEKDQGVIFEYNYETNALNIKFSFDKSPGGNSPSGGLIEYEEGEFYGMTEWGGINELGILFRYDVNDNLFEKIIDFDGLENGGMPQGSLVKASDGLIYGLTSGRGLEFGTLFQYSPESKVFKKKFDFYNSGLGYYPRYTSLIEVSMDMDHDGVVNFIDRCANTPSGESVDNDGCSESQFDDDLDGVPNSIDQCPNTQGATVNEFGCIDLLATNFDIEVVGETCIDKNNGQITIEAAESYTYTAAISGEDHDFTTNLTLENLDSGDYSVCITMAEEPSFEQCFNLVVAEANAITGKSSSKVTTGKITETVEISSGTAPYIVSVNGEQVLETSSSTISLDVLNGDEISVSTKIPCEGIFEKQVVLSDGIVVYPNPTDDFADILLPNVEMEEVEISLFNSNQQLLSKKFYKIAFGKVKISLKDKPTGIYLLQLYLHTPVNVNIIKQ